MNHHPMYHTQLLFTTELRTNRLRRVQKRQRSLRQPHVDCPAIRNHEAYTLYLSNECSYESTLV